LPCPLNLSFFWNFGSALGMLLVAQIASGILLTFYFENSPSRFANWRWIERQANTGFLFRRIHVICVNLIFVGIFIHIFRGLYYKSFLKREAWMTGFILLVVLIAISFLGYVLPWGQMSFWGARVITNFVTVFPILGKALVKWVWGGFSVRNLTIKIFFRFHFILPLFILVVVVAHLGGLHISGRRSPTRIKPNTLVLSFRNFFLLKDVINIIGLILIRAFLSLASAEERENAVLANGMSSPIHIKPEWYFLFVYAMLRRIPHKLAGFILLMLGLLVLVFFSL